MEGMTFANVLKYAIFAEKIYHQTQPDDEVFKGYTSVRIIDLPISDGKCITLENSSEQVIIARGTANIENVVSDIEVFKKNDVKLGIHLHRGFRKASSELYRNLPILSRNKKTIVTGHSLGGAIAVIVGMYLLYDGYNVECVITFGQPKVTDWRGCKAFMNRLSLFRVVNEEDPVPLIPSWSIWPLSGFFRPYRHFGEELLLEENDYKVSLNLTTSTSGAGEILKRIFKGQMKINDIIDHYMVNYMENIRKFV